MVLPELREYSEESETDSEKSVAFNDDSDIHGAPRRANTDEAKVANPRAAPVDENMTGDLDEHELRGDSNFRAKPKVRDASAFLSFSQSAASSSQNASGAERSAANFQQQKRAEQPRPSPPEEVMVRPGNLFSLLTDVSRIAIDGGDGSQDFIHSLSGYNFHGALLRNLEEIGFSEPTAVQKAVWNVMLNKYTYNLMTQAQTGSGKTFAFLIPLIQNVFSLKSALMNDKETARTFPKNAPFAVVFVPTRELVSQIVENAKQLTKGIDVNLTFGTGQNSFIRGSTSRSDIHITTMGGMMNALGANTKREHPLINASNVFFVVFDEADKYFYDFDTSEQVTKAVNLMKENPSCRIFAFSATLTANIRDFMQEGHFTIRDVHPIPATIEHHTIILQKTQAVTTLLTLLRGIKKDNQGEMPKILIFVNRRVTCDILANQLLAYNYNALSLTSKWPTLLRQRISKKFISGETKILICSDVLCPGVDWNVDVVINYHLPPIAHFHRLPNRIGRTGRAGNKGKVYSFFYSDVFVRDQVNPDDFARFLEQHKFPVPPMLAEYKALYGNPEREGDGNSSECERD